MLRFDNCVSIWNTKAIQLQLIYLNISAIRDRVVVILLAWNTLKIQMKPPSHKHPVHDHQVPIYNWRATCSAGITSLLLVLFQVEMVNGRLFVGAVQECINLCNWRLTFPFPVLYGMVTIQIAICDKAHLNLDQQSSTSKQLPSFNVKNLRCVARRCRSFMTVCIAHFC